MYFSEGRPKVKYHANNTTVAVSLTTVDESYVTYYL